MLWVCLVKHHRRGQLNQIDQKRCSSTAPITIVVFGVAVGAVSTVRGTMTPMAMVAVARGMVAMIGAGAWWPVLKKDI